MVRAAGYGGQVRCLVTSRRRGPTEPPALTAAAGGRLSEGLWLATDAAEPRSGLQPAAPGITRPERAAAQTHAHESQGMSGAETRGAKKRHRALQDGPQYTHRRSARGPTKKGTLHTALPLRMQIAASSRKSRHALVSSESRSDVATPRATQRKSWILRFVGRNVRGACHRAESGLHQTLDPRPQPALRGLLPLDLAPCIMAPRHIAYVPFDCHIGVRTDTVEPNLQSNSSF